MQRQKAKSGQECPIITGSQVALNDLRVAVCHQDGDDEEGGQNGGDGVHGEVKNLFFFKKVVCILNYNITCNLSLNVPFCTFLTFHFSIDFCTHSIRHFSLFLIALVH